MGGGACPPPPQNLWGGGGGPPPPPPQILEGSNVRAPQFLGVLDFSYMGLNTQKCLNVLYI